MSAPREIEIGRDKEHGIDVGAHRSDRSNSDERQREERQREREGGLTVEKNLRVEMCGFNFQFSDSKHAVLF